jgi:5-(carboxyamino)imidazole ribonucleotide synthase
MLAESALELGHQVFVLAHEDEEPIRTLKLPRVDRYVSGDVVVFESEFQDLSRIPESARCVPAREAFARLKSKLEQKQLFSELKLASAPFCAPSDAPARFAQGFVLKRAHGGYDGKGNRIVRPGDSWEEFVREGECYAEALVEFERELALVCARTSTGEWVSYPLVETRQERGVCREVRGPASLWGAQALLQEQAEQAARAIGDHLQLVGVYALEFFLTRGGDLLLNEMAPRVHNSGHFSRGGAHISQFDLHWLAIAGRLPTDLGVAPAFGMRNLLGPWGAPEKSVPVPLSMPGERPLWYGKSHSSEGRKMGHLVVTGRDAQEIDEALRKFEQWEASFWSKI